MAFYIESRQVLTATAFPERVMLSASTIYFSKRRWNYAQQEVLDGNTQPYAGIRVIFLCRMFD
jgi:hypothetical protein